MPCDRCGFEQLIHDCWTNTDGQADKQSETCKWKTWSTTNRTVLDTRKEFLERAVTFPKSILIAVGAKPQETIVAQEELAFHDRRRKMSSIMKNQRINGRKLLRINKKPQMMRREIPTTGDIWFRLTRNITEIAINYWMLWKNEKNADRALKANQCCQNIGLNWPQAQKIPCTVPNSKQGQKNENLKFQKFRKFRKWR